MTTSRNQYRSRDHYRCISAAMALLTTCGLLLAQAPSGANAAGHNDEVVGIRFTPKMARAIAKKMSPMFKRSGLPDDKQDEVIDKISRRIMEAAHAIDGRGQEFIQRLMEEQFAKELEGGVAGGGGGIPPKFGKEFAERALEITPAIKNLMRGMAQDIRPMLPMKEQIKFAGEMMAAKAGIDAFEETMRKWSSGEVNEFDDPFTSGRKIEKDESGQSKALEYARKSSQQQIESFAVSEWERYVKHFKQFYSLDETQCSTADSILREFKQRAEQRKRDTKWRERYFRDELWNKMTMHLRMGTFHPLRMMIEEDMAAANSWKDALTAEFKDRLDTVPTVAQRKQAEGRIEIALREKGIITEGGEK